jgi:hypothetical protein
MSPVGSSQSHDWKMSMKSGLQRGSSAEMPWNRGDDVPRRSSRLPQTLMSFKYHTSSYFCTHTKLFCQDNAIDELFSIRTKDSAASDTRGNGKTRSLWHVFTHTYVRAKLDPRVETEENSKLVRAKLQVHATCGPLRSRSWQSRRDAAPCS